MQFERTDESEYPDHPYRIKFDTVEEVEIVRSAFREIIYRRARTGNSGSISKFDLHFIEKIGTRDAGSTVLAKRSLLKLIDTLEEFHENTDDALTEIPDVSMEPAYTNDHLLERSRLGREALELANQIKSAESSLIGEDETEATVRRFRAELDSFSDD